MLSTSAQLLQTQRYPAIQSTQVPHTLSVSQPLPSHVYFYVYLSSNRSSTVAKLHVYRHVVDFSLLWCLNLRPTSCKHRDIQESGPHEHPTHILSRHHYLDMCICEQIGGQKSQKKQIYTHAVDFSLLWCSQLPPNCCKHRDIPESGPHMCLRHILSHNHYLPMCICEAIGGQKSQKSPFIPTQSTVRCFDTLNFRPTAANIEISRIQVHTGTPHPFCLTTTTFPCVFVKQ